VQNNCAVLKPYFVHKCKTGEQITNVIKTEFLILRYKFTFPSWMVYVCRSKINIVDYQ